MSMRTSDYPSVFMAEVVALYGAADYVCNNWGLYQGKNVRIYSDSRAALQAVNNFKITSKVVRDAKTRLNQAGELLSLLELHWVRAHVGHKGNERADEAAKAATELGTISISVPKPCVVLKIEVSRCVYLEWS